MQSSLINELQTPGWQYFKRAIVFVGMIIMLGTMFHILMRNNPDEWKLQNDENGEPIINGFYYSVNLLTYTGYGDYTPRSQRAILIVMLFMLVWWGAVIVMYPEF